MLIHDHNNFNELTPTKVLGRIIAHELTMERMENLMASTSHTKNMASNTRH